MGHPVVIAKGRGKGQVRLVTEVSGGTVKVNQPWLELPDTTSVYQLGGIPWRAKTGWFRLAQSEEDRPTAVKVVFGPTPTACTLDLRVYKDHATAPSSWAVDQTSEQGTGVEAAAGKADLVADMTKSVGYVQQRLDRHRELHTDGDRYLAVELAGVKNQDPVKVHKVQIDGADAEGSR